MASPPSFASHSPRLERGGSFSVDDDGAIAVEEDGQERDDVEGVDSGSEGANLPRARGTRSRAVEATGASSERARAASVPRRGTGNKTQAAFVHKLYSMIQTPSLQSQITWSESGVTFSVFNPSDFSRDVLPQFFKHNNFQSFVRQLNMYGFHKVNDLFNSAVSQGTSATAPGEPGTIAWEFQHACFQRDRPELLAGIKRKPSKPAVTVLPPPVVTRKSTSNVASPQSSLGSSDGHRDRLEGDGGFDADRGGRQQQAGGSSSRIDYGSYGAGYGGAVGGSRLQQGEFSSMGRVGTYAPPAEGNRRNQVGTTPPAPSPYVQSNPRSAPQYQQTYGSPNPIGVYTSRAPPLPPPDFDVFARSVAALETSVQRLAEELNTTQQEALAIRSATHTAVRLLGMLVAGMEANGGRRDEIESLQYAIGRLDPDSYVSPLGNAGNANFVFPHGGTQAPPSFQTNQPVVNSTYTRPATAPQSAYQRTIPAESFARGGRPDLTSDFKPFVFTPSPYPSAPSPEIYRHGASNGAYDLPRHIPQGMDPGAAMDYSFPLARNLHPGYTTTSSGYSPVLRVGGIWTQQPGVGGGGSAEPTRGGSSGGRSGVDLPSLSSLIGRGTSADGKRLGGEGDEEEGRKKTRR